MYNAYCANTERKTPLLVGLSKSVIGHTEHSSGLVSLIKILLAYENQCISASLHLNRLKTTIKPFCPPLLPVITNTQYCPGIYWSTKTITLNNFEIALVGIAGVNNFGIGGVNGNVLIEPNYKTENSNSLKIAETMPRIVNICGRTEEAFNEICDWIEANPQKISSDFLALLAETVRVEPNLNSSGLPYRGKFA